MRYAIISLGGKQFKIQAGDTFELERQKALTMDVLLFVDDSKVMVGEPYLKDIEVKAAVVEEKRDKKIRVARFKSKSRYRRVKGHRQPLSVVKIEKIVVKSEKAPAKPKKATVKKKSTSSAKKKESK